MKRASIKSNTKHSTKSVKKKAVKRALITGITGQDGSYLAELLLSKGYEVHGLVRRVAAEDERKRYSRINHIKPKLHLHVGDINDYPRIYRFLIEIEPDEIYHLAAQSFVVTSFDDDFSTMRTNIESTHYFLRAIKELGLKTKFYFAGSSEMYGQALGVPQSELTPFNPVSPYAIAKQASYALTRMYRGAYGVFATNGILFNHESPRRGLEFVTRKISHTVARIKAGLADKLTLGNPSAKRDWGFAGDYVEAMWLMLQHDMPDDYVISTGETHTVKEFVDLAFKHASLDPKKYVVYNNANFLRPAEVPLLLGDSRKAKKVLGWKPKVTFEGLVKMMVDADSAALKGERNG